MPESEQRASKAGVRGSLRRQSPARSTVSLTRLPLARPGCLSSPRSSAPQQLIAAAAVIALGLCAVAFVATQGDAPQEDSVANLYSQYGKQAALKRHTEKLIMGPGQEADDVKAIQAAWITFKDSKDETVLGELTKFDPDAQKTAVQTAIDDMDALGLETKNEGDILKKLALPDP